jgi:hypothetical protein
MIWVFAGVCLISFSLTYAWWVKARVVCLRQDIFDIRDDLFDVALELGVLDDTAYRDARDHLNNIASAASLFSIPFFATCVSQAGESRAFDKTSNAKLQEAIDKRVRRCASRIGNYLLYETFTGWSICTLFTAVRLMEIAKQTAESSIQGWLNSSSAEELSAAMQYYRRAKHDGMQTS